jgi:hypothetical protein
VLKKAILALVYFFSITALEAKTVPLDTGNWIFDTYRNVKIDEFDYLYTIAEIDLLEKTITLEDGSLWSVHPLRAESKSFYYQKGIYALSSSHIDLLSSWEQNDVVIFHQLIDRNSILAYNLTKDMLLDVSPISAPTSPLLTISHIRKIYVGHLGVCGAIIKLSDDSVWQANSADSQIYWFLHDPVQIVKNNPRKGDFTHVLLLMKPTRTRSDKEPAIEHIPVWRVS